jgi:Ca2+-binding EF-hand superfamily protein
MWRYLLGGVAVLLAIGAGVMLVSTRSGTSMPLVSAAATGSTERTPVGNSTVPRALPETREQKRFDRYDKDRDGGVTRDEYLASRRKAFAKLDRDGNGALSFDEWAVKAEAKFADADRDKSGVMDQAEFATTAVKRKLPSRRDCPEREASRSTAAEGDDT